MKAPELISLLDRSYRRSHLIGDLQNGVIAALDLEGRLFTVINGKVVNRVVPAAIEKRSNKYAYQNPGGDVLWPAPEGTRLGYEYTTGAWRVPPSVTGAEWDVIASAENRALLRAEIDLINNQQTGIPCEFERNITIEVAGGFLKQNIRETIRYIGSKTIESNDFRLAPWSLCQFNSGADGKVIMPAPGNGDVWDMYGESNTQRGMEGNLYVVKTLTPRRFQLGISKNVPWIEYIRQGAYRVKRYTLPLPEAQQHIDISDISPEQQPSDKKVSLSVYCDPSGFMEIEACGGTAKTLTPGTELSVEVVTEYQFISDVNHKEYQKVNSVPVKQHP